ncbi:hypothetical protein GZH53_17380 [Flavihumibacter sp. R14]|nr:hypothetical protein [Flavihumibacter soli]
METVMLRSRQKEITDLIKLKGLKLKQFDFQPVTNNFFKLTFRDTDLYFRTDKDGFVMRPGPDKVISHSANVGGWKPNLPYLEIWLDTIVTELEIGDPWTEDEFEHQLYEDINDEYQNGEKFFSSIEVDRISKGLLDIQNLILADTALSKTHVDLVQADIRRLEANSNKISSKDWSLLFIGIMFSWVTSGILDPEIPKLWFNKFSVYVSGLKASLSF